MAKHNLQRTYLKFKVSKKGFICMLTYNVVTCIRQWSAGHSLRWSSTAAVAGRCLSCGRYCARQWLSYLNKLIFLWEKIGFKQTANRFLFQAKSENIRRASIAFARKQNRLMLRPVGPLRARLCIFDYGGVSPNELTSSPFPKARTPQVLLHIHMYVS